MLLPPILIPTTSTPLTRSNHQQDAYPRRSSLPASLRDIMHTSVTPPTSTQVTENEESSSSSGTDQDDTPNFNDPNPRVTQLATALHSALTNTASNTNHVSPIPIIIMSNQLPSREESAFTFSFQIHRNQHDTRDTLASVDMDMDFNTIGHVADIVNAICESLSFDI